MQKVAGSIPVTRSIARRHPKEAILRPSQGRAPLANQIDHTDGPAAGGGVRLHPPRPPASRNKKSLQVAISLEKSLAHLGGDLLHDRAKGRGHKRRRRNAVARTAAGTSACPPGLPAAVSQPGAVGIVAPCRPSLAQRGRAMLEKLLWIFVAVAITGIAFQGGRLAERYDPIVIDQR